MARHKTLRQQEIVNGTRRIIIAKGMENFTVREIAKELKITDGALYRHFKSKREILSLLIDDVEDSLLFILEDVASTRKEPLGKLREIFFSHLSYAEQRRGISFVVINKTLSLKDKFLQSKMSSVISKYLKIIRVILSDGIKIGEFRKDLDVDCASVAFFGMIQSLVTLWGLNDKEYPLQTARLEKMFNIYQTGIRVK